LEEPKPTRDNSRLAYAILIFLFLVGFAVGLVTLNRSNTACRESYRTDGHVTAGRNVITVQIAKTNSQRQQGLGGKGCLQPERGMLFKFDQAGYYPFWMKDMKFPIDIVWINSAHQVADIKANVSPGTYPQSFTNSKPARDVLELSAGQAVRDGIKTGSQLNY